MVANLGLRIHELLHEKIDNIIAETLSAWEQAECYEAVVNHFQRIFTLMQDILFLGFSYIFWHNTLKNRKIIILN